MRGFKLFYFFLFLNLLSVQSKCFSQGTSFAPITFNYSTKNYQAGNQNWAIAQGDDKIIYIGNDYGLLSFDAVNWKLHRLPNSLSVKSVLVDNSLSKERIYVGSFEEFGFFEKNESNELHYVSLKHLIKDYTLYNDEVWTINKIGSQVFFQTFSSYFIYDESDDSIQVEKLFPGPLFFFNVYDKLYAQFIDDDFSIYNGKRFQSIISKNELKNDNIVSMLPFGNEILLFTSSSGIFAYNSETAELKHQRTLIDEELKHGIVNRAIALSDSTFVIGTLNNGLYALKVDGKLLWKLNQNNGLHNNTVLGLFVDKEHNLWAALDNGIASIQTNSSISIYESHKSKIGMTEDILVKDGELYLATNQGVYRYSEKEEKLKQIPDFNVQSWFIRNFDGQIITGNNLGTAFINHDKKTDVLKTSTGGTDIRAMRVNEKDFLLESTYTAFQVYTKNQQNKWVFSHKVDDFFDLIFQIEYDHSGNIWASHMYKGVYRIRLDEDLKQISQQDFYSVLDSTKPPKMPIRAMKLRGRIVIADGNSFFTYDDIAQQIIPYDLLNEQLQPLADTRKITTVNDSTFWFLRSDEYTLIRNSSGNYQIIDRIPFAILSNPPNSRRGNVFVDELEVSYFSLNGGVGKYELADTKPYNRTKLKVSQMWSYNRKRDINNYLVAGQNNIINYSNNNIYVQFQYPDFSKRKFTVEYFLENYDTRWTASSDDLLVSYPNLPAGSYNLRARVISDTGFKSSELLIPFKIKNPWYLTKWSILLYVLLFFFLLYFFMRTYISMAVNKRNKVFEQLEKERIGQLNQQEKMIVEMKNEKLESDLIHKSKELAGASMLIINHEELLSKMKKEVQQLILTKKINRHSGYELIKTIDNNINKEDEWKTFQENFDLIHKDFFKNLTKNYPSLTPGDLRLASLLRLNYSSKEIAKMLNLAPRGVESARYRLRKKLMLNPEDDLASFFNQVK